MPSNYSKETLSALLKAEARRLGFAACGVAQAMPVGNSARSALDAWLANGEYGEMSYMARHYDVRTDPRRLVEGAESIVCVALNYYPAQFLRDDQYQFAWYAYGEDYHEVMRRKLGALLDYLQSLVPATTARAFVDTAPLLERYHAVQAGIGWQGKNTQQIVPHAGSCFFLGELITTLPLAYDAPIADRCGTCRRCLDACPMRALTPYHLDARRCLSYLTIEHRGNLPPDAIPALGNRVFGCDECQRACPHNRFATPATEPSLQASPAFMNLRKETLETLSDEQFTTLFGKSAVRRTKYEGLKRNVESVSG
jgi:epoxyqueuosine reductase